MKVMLACQTATNKGDRAIAEFVISQLTAKGNEVVLSTTWPELWDNLEDKNVRVIRMGYRSIRKQTKSPLINKVIGAVNRFIINKLLFSSLMSSGGKHRLCNMVSGEFIKEVKSADLVVVTGGHHITSIRAKNAQFQFTYDIGLIGLYAKKYVLCSQTIGPLDFTSEKPKKFFEHVLKNAGSVYIRDENSIECVRQVFGDCINVKKTYDSVFGFGDMEFAEFSARGKKVGISIFDGLKKAFATYETLAKMLDVFADRGYEIEFFRMENNDHELNSIQKVIGMMKNRVDVKIHPFLTTTEEHLKEVSTCRYFIGYKTHSVIMSLATSTPLIAIAYHEKTRDFMRDYGLLDYVISDEELTFDKAKSCIDALEQNGVEIHKRQREKSYSIAKKVKQDFCEMVEYE